MGNLGTARFSAFGSSCTLVAFGVCTKVTLGGCGWPHSRALELLDGQISHWTAWAGRPQTGAQRVLFAGAVLSILGNCMASFLINTNGVVSSLQLRDDRVVVIGRARDAEVHLDDPSLSRRHCEVRKNAGVWVLRDLGSFNGTYCNNLAISEHRLQHDDQVQLGMSVLTFQLSDLERRAMPGMFGTDPQGDIAELSRRLRNFMMLLDIAKAVSGELDARKLLELVVEKGIGLTNAERGFLIRFTDGAHTFEVARNRAWQPIEEPEKKISRSVMASVFSTGEPVLTIDAVSDLAGMSQTIAALEIWSLMCAPLKVKDRVIGCIYVDSSVAEQEFSQESLNLLQAFADQAAIAIENATLYEQMQQSREAEKHVRQVFQKYVPKDVVQRALKISDGGKLSSKQTATVLFSDIRGFTSISERMEPEGVVAFLNDYLQRMVAIVFDEGGIVDKFIGDAVMAVFGAPVERPDDASRAVRAAQRMLEELDKFNEDQAKRGGVHIRIGIGVHSGPLIAGNIGSDRKMEYTVIGDTVNIASRVQDLTKDFGVEIIITQGCYEATGKSVPVRPLPPVHVKGKELALTVFEVRRPGAELLDGKTDDDDDEIGVGEDNPDQRTIERVVIDASAGPALDAPTVPKHQAAQDDLDGPTLARPPPRQPAHTQLATGVPGLSHLQQLRPPPRGDSAQFAGPPPRGDSTQFAVPPMLSAPLSAARVSAANAPTPIQAHIATSTDAPTKPPRFGPPLGPPPATRPVSSVIPPPATRPVSGLIPPPPPPGSAPLGRDHPHAPVAAIPPPPVGSAPPSHGLRGPTLRRPLGPPPPPPPQHEDD